MLASLGRRRRLVALALLALAVGLPGLLALHRLHLLAEASRDLALRRLPAVQAVARLAQASERHRALLPLHLLEADRHRLAATEAEIAEARRLAEDARRAHAGLAGGAEEQGLHAEVGRLWAEYAGAADRLLALSRQGRTAEAAALLQAETAGPYRRLRDRLDRLAEIQADGADHAALRAMRKARGSITLILALLGGCILAGAASAMRGPRREAGAARPPGRPAPEPSRPPAAPPFWPPGYGPWRGPAPRRAGPRPRRG